MQAIDEHRPDPKAHREYHLERMPLEMVIGVYKYERTLAQQLFISVKVRCACPLESNLAKLIPLIIREYGEHHRPFLLERMAYDLLKLLWTHLTDASGVSILIEKPNALANARCSYARASVNKD